MIEKGVNQRVQASRTHSETMTDAEYSNGEAVNKFKRIELKNSVNINLISSSHYVEDIQR